MTSRARDAETPQARAWTPRPTGLRVCVRVTPRASRSVVEALVVNGDGRAALKVRLAAPPVDGAANAALLRLLSDCLDLRRSDVMLAAGESSRDKLVDLVGDPQALEAKILAVLGVGAAGSMAKGRKA